MEVKSELNLKDAYIKRYPESVKNMKSFYWEVEDFSIETQDVSGLVSWLEKQGRKEEAAELSENADRVFTLSITNTDGEYYQLNSNLLSYDRTNSLDKVVKKVRNSYVYNIASISWDADTKTITFA